MILMRRAMIMIMILMRPAMMVMMMMLIKKFFIFTYIFCPCHHLDGPHVFDDDHDDDLMIIMMLMILIRYICLKKKRKMVMMTLLSINDKSSLFFHSQAGRQAIISVLPTISYTLEQTIFKVIWWIVYPGLIWCSQILAILWHY